QIRTSHSQSDEIIQVVSVYGLESEARSKDLTPSTQTERDGLTQLGAIDRLSKDGAHQSAIRSLDHRIGNERLRGTGDRDDGGRSPYPPPPGPSVLGAWGEVIRSKQCAASA